MNRSREEMLAEVAEYLIDQRDEPWPGADADRLHYWRDKAIHAANRLRTLARENDGG